jgi:hypothetical protein
MALPIWGIWMKKCLADGIFSEDDRFVAPAGVNLDLACTGGDIETTAEGQAGNKTEEDYYFE